MLARDDALAKLFRYHKRSYGLRALPRKAFFIPRTTNSTHGRSCSPNHLLHQPAPTQASRVWVSYISYLLWAFRPGRQRFARAYHTLRQ